ncbi:unnamed protein product [Vitrella brassicaformis CCMP3155]|uniref:TLDc domain-containing protein n=2 Tax=Vitrella brassicaformis TaxID=1169539 RepID=A0A0G4GTE5_VITBC|nr:unnamed protein product [Vitrella brassicaformis CCMP3155]|eukprot:CEM33992.1 unnamed protein product [Vitrella brassicaformis CCMP3155]
MTPVGTLDTSLSESQYSSLLGLLGNPNMKLASIYRSSRDGSRYEDLLRCVGDKTGLVIIIRKGKYVFGVYISAGLQEPDDPTDTRRCECDILYISLAGHFATPTKIDLRGGLRGCGGQAVFVTGREGSAGGTRVYVAGCLWMGCESDEGPAVGICRCEQYTNSWNVPAGYTGERNSTGDALLAGEESFHADEREVLHVVGQ